MTLQELSPGYRESAEKLRRHLRALRQAIQAEQNPDRKCRLKQDYLYCTYMHRECRDLAKLTAHYYERGFYRDGKYTV